ncbi:putative uncharacterized protein C7orf78 homolog isoform X2 [Ascaphus truei]
MCTDIKSHTGKEQSYLFARQVRFTADQNLATERSKHFMKSKIIPDHDIWKKQPPDFSVSLYKSLRLPRKPVELEDEKKDRKNKNRIQFPKREKELLMIHDNHLPDLVKQEEPLKLLTRFKHVGPFEAQIMYVKSGLYPKDKYKDPKPHDFRQYETGIPDFVTSYFRDPFNITFNSQSLNFVHRLEPLEEKWKNTNNNNNKSLMTFKPPGLKWDRTLILHKSPWPPKSGSFT